MRVKKSFLNAVSNSAILVIRSILMFVVRIVVVKMLGQTYLGIDSLFTNVLLVLSIADSGISTAINFSLYKPLSDKDYKKVSLLMSYYKKMYRLLGFIVLGIGILFIPALPIVIKESVDNIYIYYIIYLLTTVIPYFLSYKEALLTADQNMYKSSIIMGLTYISLYVLRIVFLLIRPSFFIYSIILLIITLIQRYLVNRYITKKYPYISFNEKENISQKEQKSIFVSAKSMFLNKLGYYLVAGSDNIIISSIPTLGLSAVAIYTNYYSIVGTIDNIITRGLSGVTASFGDLAVNESKKTQENVFNIISFVAFLVYGLFTIGFAFLLTPLIKICFGSGFNISNEVLLIVCINFYLVGMAKPLDVIKEATGNYYQDRYVNLLQAFINIVLSIILGKLYGLLGIVLATLISFIVLPMWNRPYIAYKYIFGKSPKSFIKVQIKYVISLLLVYAVCWPIVSNLIISNKIVEFLIKVIIVTIIYIILIMVIYHKSEEEKYLIKLVKDKVVKQNEKSKKDI